jgi:trehalose 6-phosphate phosphatase
VSPSPGGRGDLPAALRAAVAALAGARPRVLLLDVDGTLAPIAPRPEDARVPDGTLAVLAALAAAPHTHVALVTGRAPADARRMVPVRGLWVIGNHGAEREAPDGTLTVDPGVAAHGPALRAAVAELAAGLAGVPGALVEDKGWSVTAHFRLAAPADAARVADAARAAARRHGLAARDGKMVVELRAPVAVDKGTAARALLGVLGADARGAGVLAAGDDVTDEDLFRALAAARPGGRDPLTVRVGPDAAPTAAGFRVPDPPAVAALLGALAAA